MTMIQTLIVQKDDEGKTPGPMDAPVRLINPDGTPFTGSGSADASITTVDVSVDATTGTPSASGSVSGSTLTLSFTGLKGEKGDTGAAGAAGKDGADGVTPSITASATVDSTTGTPKVTVSKSGTDEAPEFEFAFTGLKGAKGDTGAQGPAGADGTSFTKGAAVSDATGAEDVTTQLNALLASLRAAGVIATA